MQNILGVVLCGGLSKRMGSDKGLLPLGDTIWAKYGAAKLTALNIPVVFSINPTQQDAYAHYISTDKLVVDSTHISGPLNGLLSVHKKFPEQHLLLLACDMLEMDTATITQVMAVYQQQPGYDFYVYQDAEYAQPFCGIYTSNALAAILLKAENNQLEKFSMQYLLNGAHTKRITIEKQAAFSNCNHKPTH